MTLNLIVFVTSVLVKHLTAQSSYMIPVSNLYQTFQRHCDNETSADSNQTVGMRRLICIYTGHKCPDWFVEATLIYSFADI